jgi:4-alpha-glucanotransferase
MNRRGSGILLHITSLPSPHGIGDIGPWAYKFADFLFETKQSFWQILPLNPTNVVYGNSPYLSISAFARNPLLISPELLVKEGFLAAADLKPLINHHHDSVDYERVVASKKELLSLAYKRFKENKHSHDYDVFCMDNTYWLEDFALFTSLKDHFNGQEWSAWPREIRDRQPEALQEAKKELYESIEKEKFLQFIFARQWLSLKRYCNNNDIHIIGDLPIYVNYDSVDVWSNVEIFKLDGRKRPYVIAGVPPDYFSATGQLWGNPLYNWEALKSTGYGWWILRMEHNLKFFDFVRVDHFRGFVAYWEVPAFEKTAMNGRWIEAPAADFFKRLTRKFPVLPIIAEDLGIITPDVREIMQQFELSGMKLLLFAFGEDLPSNPYIPHNLARNCVIYTGTHDNNTTKGWFEKEATQEDKKRLFAYLGREVPAEDLHWELIRIAMMSVANTAIFPMQDVLGLGEEARMNRPATTVGNWQWQLLSDQLTSSMAKRLLAMTEIYGRA